MLALRLDRGLAMHLEKLERDVVWIFPHALLAAVPAGHHPLGAVESALEQHELEPLIGLADRLNPFGPESGVHLAPPVRYRHRHLASAARLADVARLTEHRQECARLRLRPVALRALLELRLLRGDQRHLLRGHDSLPGRNENRAELLEERPDSLFLTVPD